MFITATNNNAWNGVVNRDLPVNAKTPDLKFSPLMRGIAPLEVEYWPALMKNFSCQVKVGDVISFK